ncbi:MAG: Stp1/IreP family PP2C-type Ser/Thr phosphatase [Proteobacteria bacterium]|nr:Stp1/IreP family PP2C-type Ser/Thr phosphatase [Pseudomonadota bacterium]
MTDSIQFWAETDVGRVREHNEDNFLVDKNLQLFVVADGMGGHAAGEVASGIAVTTVQEVVAQNKDLMDAIRENSRIASPTDVLNLLEHAVQKACADIHAMAERDPAKRGMGTTLSALLLIDNRGYIAHVGDSRLYLLRAGRVIQLSEDHSLVAELIRRGKLNPADAENSPYKNAVTRAVGVYESVEVDTIDFEVLPGDQFLLASDGLTGYLENTDITDILNPDEDDLKKITRAFIDLANARGGNDNITNIVVRINDHDGQAALRLKEVDQKIATLRQMPIFKLLTRKEALFILNITGVIEVQDQRPIIVEGDPGEDLFIILAGRVRVHKDGADIVTLASGNHFGEMALIDNAPRSASVSAQGTVKLLRIARSDFFNTIRNEPRLANKLLWGFLQVLSARLRTTSAELSGVKSAHIEDLTEELFEIESDD